MSFDKCHTSPVAHSPAHCSAIIRLATSKSTIHNLVFPITVSYAVPLGLDLASFLAFCSCFCFFLLSAFFSSCFLFRLLTSSSVFCTGLKKPSNRACWAVLRFLFNLDAALRTRSSLKPFSCTRNWINPSTSGASHLKSHSGSSAGRTSGSKKSKRASL